MGPRAIVSIELLLDPDAESRVREEWNALADAGLPSMAAHPAPSNRPHITLMVRERIPEFPVDSLVGRMPVAAALGAPMLFGAARRRVLARSVIPSPALIALHADLHRIVGPGDDAVHTRPGEWTPHVTLARRLRLEDVPQAIDLVEATIPARGVRLRRWDAASRTVTPLGPDGPD